MAWALTRARLLPLGALVLACTGLYCAAHTPALLSSAPILGAQAENAVHTSIALCGLLTSLIFFGQQRKQPFRDALLLALALTVLAYVLRPYFRISKIYATPSWALYSSAICVLLFAALYWVVDVRRLNGWTAFLRPAAANPLLVYIIPYIVYALMQLLHLALPDVLGSGMPGLLWALAYAMIVMALAAGLNRMHITLQL